MCNGNEDFYRQFSKYGALPNFDRRQFRFDVRNGRFPERKQFQPHVPTKLRTIVQKCLNVEPGKRYRSALDVANALAGVDGQILDWRLVEAGGKRTWSKNEKGTSWELVVSAGGSSECRKTVGAGISRRVTGGCMPSISMKEITKFLESN